MKILFCFLIFVAVTCCRENAVFRDRNYLDDDRDLLKKLPQIFSFRANNRTKEPGLVRKPYSIENKLMAKLFAMNFSEIRPALRHSKPVIVTLEFVMRQINDLVERTQQIITTGFIKINWVDPRLRWDPKRYGGIEWVVISPDTIWLPDIALVNSDDLYDLTRDNRFPVTLTSKGELYFVPAGKIHARCNFDLRFFPFDYQFCKYRFESWVYPAELVTVVGTNFTVDEEHFADSHQWAILVKFVQTSIVNTTSYDGKNFSRVEFFLLVRRKSIFFVAYIIFPCLALTWLQIASHMLPFTENERIKFATTIMIAFSVFHVSIAEQMPQSGHSIPILAIFIDGLMCLIGLCLIECLTMMNWLTRVGCSVPSPERWQLVVENWGRYVFLGSNGLYWRRQYLRVFFEVEAVNRQQSDEKQRESIRINNTEHLFRVRGKEDFARKFSSVTKLGLLAKRRKFNRGYKSENDAVRMNSQDIASIIKIAKRWGCQPTRRTSKYIIDMPQITCTAENGETADLLDKEIVSSSSDSEMSQESSRKNSADVKTASLLTELGRDMSYALGYRRASQINAAPQWSAVETQLTLSLKFLERMGNVVKTGLENHNLRRECNQIWTVYITVIDRILSGCLFVVCICTPFVLFVVFPLVVPIPALHIREGDP